MADKNAPLILVAVIVAAVIILSSIGILEPGTVIPQTMPTYDDFTTGLRDDLWTFAQPTYIHLENDKLRLSMVFGQVNGIATSKREWGTENLRIKVRAEKFESPDGGPGCSLPFTPSLTYAGFDVPLFLGATSFPCARPQCRESCTNHDSIIDIIRFDDTDLTKFVVLVNGVEVGTGQNLQPEPLRLVGGELIVDYVWYEPYFSCEVNTTTEVVVRDKFTGGSAVSLNSLTFTPLKFCPQDLGTLIFSSEGLTDEKGTITQRIAEGETLTIPDDQFWQIDYISKFVDEMVERCDTLGDAYDTNLQTCVSQVHQQVLTQQCDLVADCPTPCEGLEVSCISNECIYTGQCLAPPATPPSTNLFELIQTIWTNFWNAVRSLFGG